MIVAGVGTRKGVAAAEVVSLIARALREASIEPGQLSAIATIADKASEPGIVSAATTLNLKVLPIADEAMHDVPGTLTPSAAAQVRFGVASVSEAAALIAAGPASKLVLPRISSAMATCALARSAPA